MKGHPGLSEEQARLLLCFGYTMNEDLDRWLEHLFLMPTNKLMKVVGSITKELASRGIKKVFNENPTYQETDNDQSN